MRTTKSSVALLISHPRRHGSGVAGHSLWAQSVKMGESACKPPLYRLAPGTCRGLGTTVKRRGSPAVPGHDDRSATQHLGHVTLDTRPRSSLIAVSGHHPPPGPPTRLVRGVHSSAGIDAQIAGSRSEGRGSHPDDDGMRSSAEDELSM